VSVFGRCQNIYRGNKKLLSNFARFEPAKCGKESWIHVAEVGTRGGKGLRISVRSRAIKP